MQGKKASLIVDLREGQDMTKVTDVIAVLAAAGWETDIALKEYGGESLKLAAKAAQKGYDVVIAYGGDGTLNQIVNGVLSVKEHSIVGVIPGGTANEWAGEIGVPGDHMQAALMLIDSDARKVDLGHVGVQGLIFPEGMQSGLAQEDGKEDREKKTKSTAKTKQYFLLMAGLGIDAAVISHTSKSLKYHLGRVAFDIAAAKELPEQQPFPVEIRILSDAGRTDVLWRGETLQVIVANTRRYANVVQIAPDAYLDDGLLNVCVITAGNPIKTIEQITSLLLKHQPDSSASRYFRGAHIGIRVPASIRMQLDGDAVELKDYLNKSDREAVEQVQDRQQVMVDYLFNAEPHALLMAIPRTYDGTLFERPFTRKNSQPLHHQEVSEDTSQQSNKQPEEVQRETSELVNTILQSGTQVKVVGVAPNPAKKHTYIIAGHAIKQNTDETLPVAVRVDDDTIVLRHSGEHVSAATVQGLQEGMEIAAEGKKNKRGVLKATHVLL